MTWMANSVAAVPTRPSIDSAPATVRCGDRAARHTTTVVTPRIPATMAATMRWAKWAIWSPATVAFASIFLAFAAPGVPRGAFLMLTPLFLEIGLPAEGIGILRNRLGQM